MKKCHVARCQFSAWYATFRAHTIKRIVRDGEGFGEEVFVQQWIDHGRIVIPLPQDVISYLLDDGTVVIPGRLEPARAEVEEGDDVQWSDEDEDTSVLTAPEFPEFEVEVRDAIETLGGSVFPKLNWSSPKDAQWIALNSSLKCFSMSDIFLLFKSSDFITHDLAQPFLHCTDDSPNPEIKYELVLRKWCELIPGGEFRCFVKENKLLAIAQRDHSQYYPHLERQRDEIRAAIQDFYTARVHTRFPSEDYVFDVYRDSQGRVWLIDFNPFGEVTDALLFSWDELRTGRLTEPEAEEQDLPALRCATSESYLQPSAHLGYRLPRDFVDLSTGQDPHKLMDLLKISTYRRHGDHSSDDEAAP